MPTISAPPPPANIFDDDEEGWQDMPVVREDEFASGLDEEDQKKYHYVPSAKGKAAANATGKLIDVDDLGNEWRSKLVRDESEYTRLRVNEEQDADEVHLRTKYLFDEDKAMTPLSQMQATKNLLTEAQRIAYVGLCALTSREMAQSLKSVRRKELKAAVADMELWAMKIMGRLYYHMELETQEQKMIESLAEHGVQAMDLVPSLMTTHTVANPEYDPEEARIQAADAELRASEHPDSDDESISETLVDQDEEEISPPSKSANGATTPTSPNSPTSPTAPKLRPVSTVLADGTLSSQGTMSNPATTTKKVLKDTTSAIPGVTTTLSSADANVTLDIRWTVLCDLFLLLIADSVYDARSRVLLENVALKLGLGWLDVVKFESRVTEALEIQEDVDKLEQQQIVEGVRKAGKRRRYMMLGLATLGGGLVIGLSAGLLAPVIGAGIAGAFTTIGVTGTGAFLGGTAGAAVITTGGVLTGSSIAVRGMANRTQQLRTFDILPLHNNKRVSCILTVPGFMNGINDDVRLPFSVLDPIVGDVFSVLWEPEMIRETGSALKILTGEVLSQIGLTVLQATAMTTLMSALQWPIILTKLGYLIDNPWSNALDRAKLAGAVLADVLIQRHLGVRPVTLIGFSLGARVIFYALIELAKRKQFGIVQDVFLLGATLTASTSTWCETRSVVSGRYVNGFAKNDWVLNYLFRASSGGVGTVAGLRPVLNVPGLENVDVTDKIAGHMSYRTFMPLILDQLGFPVFADHFDEPEEPDFDGERVVVREEDEKKKKKGWFGKKKSSNHIRSGYVSRPPSASTFARKTPGTPTKASMEDDLPPRMEANGSSSLPVSPRSSSFETPGHSGIPSSSQPSSGTSTPTSNASSSNLPPLHAGFDIAKMKQVLGEAERHPHELEVPAASGSTRSQSTPPNIPSWGYDDGLSSSFARSVTVSGYEQDEEEENTRYTASSSKLPEETYSRTPRPSQLASELRSEPDEEKPSWVSSSTTSIPSISSRFGSLPPMATNPFSPSLSSPSASPGGFGPFASPTLNSSGFASPSTTFGTSQTFAPTSPSLLNNPFAAPASGQTFGASDNVGLGLGLSGSNLSFGPPDAGLAFGTADGSITSILSSPDPWTTPNLGTKKKADGFSANSNPWS